MRKPSDGLLELIEIHTDEYDLTMELQNLLIDVVYVEGELATHQDEGWQTRYLHCVELLKQIEWIPVVSIAKNWFFCPSCNTKARKRIDGEWTKRYPNDHSDECELFKMLYVVKP